MIKVNISSVLEGEEDEKVVKEEVSKIGGGIELSGKLSFVSKIYKADDGVLANIEISGKEKVTCDRCLEEFEKDINKSFSQEFVLPTKNLQGEEEEDKIAGFIIDEKMEVDLEKPIIEEILLDDTRNICKPQCKGLCLKCGKTLNRNTCNCQYREKASSPFNKLKQLKTNH